MQEIKFAICISDRKDKFIRKLNISEAYRNKIRPIEYKIIMEQSYRQEEKRKCENNILVQLALSNRSDEFRESILIEIEEAGYTHSFRIMNTKPCGMADFTKQYDRDYNTWVDQSCGMSGDDYSGTICIELEENIRYLVFEYAC